MVSLTPQLVYPHEGDPGTNWIGRWRGGPRVSLDILEKRKIFDPAGIWTQERPAHSTVYIYATYNILFLRWLHCTHVTKLTLHATPQSYSVGQKIQTENVLWKYSNKQQKHHSMGVHFHKNVLNSKQFHCLNTVCLKQKCHEWAYSLLEVYCPTIMITWPPDTASRRSNSTIQRFTPFPKQIPHNLPFFICHYTRHFMSLGWPVACLEAHNLIETPFVHNW